MDERQEVRVMRRIDRVVLAGALLLIVAACGDATVSETATSLPPLDSTAAPPTPRPAAETSLCTLVDGPSCAFDYGNFDDPTVIDNPYLPMIPGTQLIFEGTTNEDELLEHQVVITVTDLTKVIDGIETVVSWDLDFSDGELAEAELAFFAQDNDGNVWRMGEHPEEYEDGVLVEAPTWFAGVNGAKAGISMLGEPLVGSLSYSQGWGPDVEFIDRGIVAELGVSDCVEAGCYTEVLVIGEFNVLEAGAYQFKYFAPGVGNIRVDWSGTDTTREELQLVDFRQLTVGERAAANDAALALEANAYEISPDIYGQTAPAQQVIPSQVGGSEQAEGTVE